MAERPRPDRLLDGGVEVRVDAAGLCGSDLHKLLHERPGPAYLRTDVLGHEIAGIVTRCGPAVSRVREGDRVAVQPLLPCGECARCRAGRDNLCAKLVCLGRDLAGGFAEYVYPDERQLHVLPSHLDFAEGALADVVAVAVHCLRAVRPTASEWTAAVVGDGALGHACAQVARHFGASDVVLVARHEGSRPIADAARIHTVVVPADAPRDALAGYAASRDVVIEAVGGRQSRSLTDSIDLAVPGGVVGVLGVYDFSFESPLPLRAAFAREVSLVGLNSYTRFAGRPDFEWALDLLSSREVDVRGLVTSRYRLDEFSEAVAAARARARTSVIRAIFEPSRESEG